MWLVFAFLSATLLGFYDVFKKQSLAANAVMPILLLNTLFSSLIFLPLILLSLGNDSTLQGSIFYVPPVGIEVHGYIVVKSLIVLSSWGFGYVGIKQLPLTIVGPINATRPVMVLVGAMLVFGERLNLYQTIGVLLAVGSFLMLSGSGKREGIDFKHIRYIYFVVLASLLGAVSGLYDKYLMAPEYEGGLALDRMVVQGWYNIYQLAVMSIVTLVVWYPHRKQELFKWRSSILLISVFVSAADFLYFYALSLDGAMISVVSMIRRGSVMVSFVCGALLFREKNLKSKAVDLLLVLIGMIFLYLGSK